VIEDLPAWPQIVKPSVATSKHLAACNLFFLTFVVTYITGLPCLLDLLHVYLQCPPVPDMNPEVPDWIRMDRGRAGEQVMEKRDFNDMAVLHG
jgi:hypothetical protein